MLLSSFMQFTWRLQRGFKSFSPLFTLSITRAELNWYMIRVSVHTSQALHFSIFYFMYVGRWSWLLNAYLLWMRFSILKLFFMIAFSTPSIHVGIWSWVLQSFPSSYFLYFVGGIEFSGHTIQLLILKLIFYDIICLYHHMKLGSSKLPIICFLV